MLLLVIREPCSEPLLAAGRLKSVHGHVGRGAGERFDAEPAQTFLAAQRDATPSA